MGTYVDVGPVHTWFETRGEGVPLLLMHGGLETNASWGAQLDALAEHFRVVAPERRGHGHTPDVEGPISYRVMTDDTIRFLEEVVGGPAHLVGWSDGAVVALMIALERPDLVRRLVLIGGNVDRTAFVPAFHDAVELPADSPVYQPFRAVYEAVSPDGPDHWPTVFAKLTRMWRTEPDIPFDALAGVRARTLVMVGDDDLVTLEHTIALYRAIPDAELAVVPGASHLAPLEKPGLVNRVLLDFLRLEPTPEVVPVRRMATSQR